MNSSRSAPGLSNGAAPETTKQQSDYEQSESPANQFAAGLDLQEHVANTRAVFDNATCDVGRDALELTNSHHSPTASLNSDSGVGDVETGDSTLIEVCLLRYLANHVC